MHLRVGSWLTGVALLALALGFTVLAPQPAMAQRAEVADLVAEGYDLWRRDKPAEARKKFEEALLLEPSSQEAFDAVQRVGFDELIAMQREKSLVAAASAFIRLASTEVRHRERDEDAIASALSSYFDDDNPRVYAEIRQRAIAKHGVYLIPGLVERLNSSNASVKTKAILALRWLEHDAVVPLCRALQMDDATVVQGICAALGHIKNPAAIASLLHVAATTNDQVVREEAAKAIRECGGNAQADAYEALVAEGRRFYLNPSHMHYSYHDPIVWEIMDGKLSYKDVHGWRRNELVAGQWITDAIELDPAKASARMMEVCNHMAQYAEFEQVKEVLMDRGESEEQVAQLKSEERDMTVLKLSVLGLPAEHRYGALDQALSDNRPEVAEAILRAFTEGVAEGERADSVPSAVIAALTYDGHRGVRFAAAEYLAYLDPVAPFASSDEVIPQLADGMRIAGLRLALTVLPNEDDRIRVHGVLSGCSVQSFNEESAYGGLGRARQFPPQDLIVIAAEYPADQKLTTPELIAKLRKDDRTKSTPILVVADDLAFERVRDTYERESDNIRVIARTIEKVRLRDDVLANLWSDDTDARARTVDIASRAAKALHFLATEDETIYDVASAEQALIDVLENRDARVQIPASLALAAMKSDRAVAALTTIITEESAASPEDKVDLISCCFKAIGDIQKGKGEIAPEVERALDMGESSESLEVIKAARRARGDIGAGLAKPAVLRGDN